MLSGCSGLVSADAGKSSPPAATAPSITAQPASQAVTTGQTAAFSVTAAGTDPLSYQWQKNGTNIAGATSSSYTTPATASADNGAAFRAVVSNTAGTATSTAATLTVTASATAPAIMAQPDSQTVTAGQTATFSVTASGTGPLGYQWQKNGANITGATSSNYTTPATTTADSGSAFRVVVSNTAGTVTSTAATLTVTASATAPAITAQPASQTVTAGQTAAFSVTATGTGPLSYQWQKNGANITGATSSSYTTPATTTADNGSTFRVVVSNTAGTVTSTAATLTVNAPSLKLSTTTMNFGSIVVGSNSSWVLILTNAGTATLNITQVTVTGSAYSASGYSLPLNVSPGQQTTITVNFKPATTGTASGSISLTSNAPNSPASVSLSGTGVAATYTLSIGPASLSFGNVTTGTTSPAQNVTISNTGNSSVTISQIALSGAGFLLTGGSAPVTLSPAQNLTLGVQFSPTTAGTVSGSITITSNASGSPATVVLSGTGVTTVQHSVDLNWAASTTTVAGYNIYQGSTTGGPYIKVNTGLVTLTSYTDSSVQSGLTYYYVATAVDATGVESLNSNEVAAIIP